MTEPSGFKAEMDRVLAEAMHEWTMNGNLYLEPTEDGLPIVRKASYYMPVSCCQLTDSTGVNHCEHPPPPPVPWRRRLRWRISDRWWALRLRLGSWVAGRDLDEEE
jgi:hypothetical protein